MRIVRGVFPVFVSSVLLFGCGKRAANSPMPTDTIKPSGANTLARSVDTSHDTAFKAAVDTVAKSDLPPMAKAVQPDQLAQFLPTLAGWTPSGELQKEIQVHDNFNKSRVMQAYTNGSKKLTIEINDFAYVPYLYATWSKFHGSYLDDDNTARTETTTISGYHAVQSMEKKDPYGTLTVFPGNRYVVTLTEDGATDINELRSIAGSLNLKGLEALQ